MRDGERRPNAGATTEIWHADGNGNYGNHLKFRGHQPTAGDGHFDFESVRPYGYGKRSFSMAGWIDYRSAHQHVKICKDGETFTFQLWFPDDDERNPAHITYGRLREKKVLSLERGANGLVSPFDFVL